MHAKSGLSRDRDEVYRDFNASHIKAATITKRKVTVQETERHGTALLEDLHSVMGRSLFPAQDRLWSFHDLTRRSEHMSGQDVRSMFWERVRQI